MRAVIYARVSLDARGQGLSVGEQVAECEAWARREGWDVTEIISETGSASRYARSTGARTRWGELTNILAAGQHGILLTWESSRATRELGVYADLRDLCARTGVLWGYSGTVYDLTNRSDRFKTGLDALMSEDESHRTSERVLRSVRARAAAGRPHGRIPYGYRREYDPSTGALLRQVIDEETAPVVRGIFERVAAGDTFYAIARDLTDDGIPLPRAASTGRLDTPWNSKALKDIVNNPTYVGKRVHRGQVVGDASWPALVAIELQERALAALQGRAARNPTGDATARWLLSGIARCGRERCGGAMRHVTSRGADSYRCSRCKRVVRKMAPVDEHVVDLTLALLRHAPTPDEADESAELRAALEQAEGLEQRLEAFTVQGIEGQLSAARLARIEAKLAPQIAAARAKARRLAVPDQLRRWDLRDVDALWGSLDVAGRRALIRDAVMVTVLPGGVGRAFDPDLIEVTPTWADSAGEPLDDDAGARP